MNKYFSSSSFVQSDRLIYTPSSFARSSLLYLQETGSLNALSPHTSSRANLASFLFFMVTSGEGQLVYGGVEYELEEGDLVFIDCTVPYSHSTGKNLWSLSWCHFNGPEMIGIYEKYKSRGGKAVFRSAKNMGEYKNLLENLLFAARSSSYIRDMEINLILSSFLVLLMEDSWNPVNISNKQGQVVNIREYIDAHYSTDITLESLSDQFFINKTYLSEVFKEQYGVNLKDYLTSVRITEAKKLLRFTDKTTEEIAENIGINGAAYFSRLFKRVEGVSPKEYRAMW